MGKHFTTFFVENPAPAATYYIMMANPSTCIEEQTSLAVSRDGYGSQAVREYSLEFGGTP